MPGRKDIKKILIIGSGPIVIGQACEFDYSGAQACKVLKSEGYHVILINSNPATIMTDPEMADQTYVEPITVETIEKIIIKEKPDSILPTLGGQTALNAAVGLAEQGILDKYNVKLLGANLKSIRKAENRDLFKEAMDKIGLESPKSDIAHTLEEALDSASRMGFPLIIRPSFTLGGSGGNVAYNIEEFREFVSWGLNLSPENEVLIEESVAGWKEYELEVMRDRKDNVVIICSIENLDPMGVHTGDSITVAPAQTLTDKEYQVMRDASLKIIREIGVDTGGSNIQFAVNPRDGRIYVIEMNPRVSRSSALASKATGFPIAKIAAKLAVGFTLDEIQNDITRETPACFEPTIDYVVTKWPRFTFEKFPETASELTVQMKSVGEAMSIGRTFKESLQKAIRSLEIERYSLDNCYLPEKLTKTELIATLKTNCWDRIWYVAEALRRGLNVDEVYAHTGIDPWFINNILDIIRCEKSIKKHASANPKKPETTLIADAKKMGFSDRYLCGLYNMKEKAFRKFRLRKKIVPVFKKVDTCAAEFEAYTPYFYSSYDFEDEAVPSDRRKIMILGGGPNRIGQGIEFDYCCVHAAFALREENIETIMVNCNPETVSTDYDTSDRLYFEPLTYEDVMSIIDTEKPDGLIVQFGGQTPLKLADSLKEAGVNIIGTSPESIAMAEDRKLFSGLIRKLKLKQPPSGTATSYGAALKTARRLKFPLMIRPSFVLGGRAMEIVYDEKELRQSFDNAIFASPEHPVLIDKFLEGATEVDVDAICDGKKVVIGGVMEHIEEAGVHSGDSACVLPPIMLEKKLINEIKKQTKEIALAMEVRGLLNIQFAVKDGEIFILEVNPRASRTIPFVSKTIGVPLAKLAAKVMSGRSLRSLGFVKEVSHRHLSVKEAVFPFLKFTNVDTMLGPEMKSTGEVMGVDYDFGRAFAKSQLAAGVNLPLDGTVFISVKDSDKKAAIEIAAAFYKMGFKIIATRGTCINLIENNIPSEFIRKVAEGRPNIVDAIINGDANIVINTTAGKQPIKDSFSLRRSSLDKGVPYFTTVQGALAAAKAVIALKNKSRPLKVMSLQRYYKS
ncbi:MAG: carbamoyl-phosphate synthase large subunit [Fibrobacterota bacterium]